VSLVAIDDPDITPLNPVCVTDKSEGGTECRRVEPESHSQIQSTSSSANPSVFGGPGGNGGGGGEFASYLGWNTNAPYVA
jgi:hypothetical protein